MIQSGLKLKGRRGLHFCTYLADVIKQIQIRKKEKLETFHNTLNQA